MSRSVSGKDWEIVLGDCFEVMPKLGCVDHVITDPPYEAQAHTKARRSLKDATQRKGAVNTGEVRRIDAPLEITFDAITEAERTRCGELFRELSRRWVLAFCQIEGVTPWKQSFESGGLQWVRGGVWVKPNGAPQFTGDRPGQGFECIAIAHTPGKKRWNGGGRHAVWCVPLDHGAGNGERNPHPTTKPDALMSALVADFTSPGDWVLDPFMGSGSTGVACLKAGRKFFGIERNETYFELAVARLRAAEQGQTVSQMRDGFTTFNFGDS